MPIYKGNTPIVGGGATVVETGRSEDGSQWYRLWSDGWLEQGGVQQGTAVYGITTVSLLKPYKDTSYFISSSIATLSTQWFTFTTTVQGQAITDICGTPCNITVQSFDLQSFSTHNWYACGQS